VVVKKFKDAEEMEPPSDSDSDKVQKFLDHEERQRKLAQIKV